MTSRVCLVVGCNDYVHLVNLGGAEADARRVCDALVTRGAGQYDNARLILSPSREDLRNALVGTLGTSGDIDTFTLYFAGHGVVHGGSFFLCVRDTNPSFFAGTAISLSEIFIMLAEIAPAQTNIIIDACESGGLISDLHSLLKPELIGESGTPGITLLATSAKNQYAKETHDGGIGTSAVLKCVSGDAFLSDATPALDLIDIGRHVSEEFAATDQTPVVWGLNLYGPRRFCLNPHYAGDKVALRALSDDLADPDERSELRALSATVWRRYLSSDERLDPRGLHDGLSDIFGFLADRDIPIASHVERTFSAALELYSAADDAFVAIEAGATCALATLPYLDREDLTPTLQALLRSLSERLGEAFLMLHRELDANRYAILGRNGPVDLFYLPLRLTKLLGWAGFRDLLNSAGLASDGAEPVTPRLLRKFAEDYQLSLRSMSDAQAPYITIALAACVQVGAIEPAESLASLLFHDLTSCSGRVADPHLDGEGVFRYLVQRASGQWLDQTDHVAQPTELALQLLRFAPLLGLRDAFDEAMHLLDHVWLGAFIPHDFRDYGRQVIKEGRNLNFKIGHDVWKISDIEKVWPDDTDRAPTDECTGMLVILAALLFPDRTPQFLVPREN
jgi:hypothetical protein